MECVMQVAPVVGTPRQVVLLAKGVKGFAAKGYGLEGCFRTVETAPYNLIFFVGSVVSRMDLELLRMRFKGTGAGGRTYFCTVRMSMRRLRGRYALPDLTDPLFEHTPPLVRLRVLSLRLRSLPLSLSVWLLHAVRSLLADAVLLGWIRIPQALLVDGKSGI
jgi:hypothetical protein